MARHEINDLAVSAARKETARSAMYGRRPRCKRNLTFPRSVRVQKWTSTPLRNRRPEPRAQDGATPPLLFQHPPGHPPNPTNGIFGKDRFLFRDVPKLGHTARATGVNRSRERSCGRRCGRLNNRLYDRLYDRLCDRLCDRACDRLCDRARNQVAATVETARNRFRAALEVQSVRRNACSSTAPGGYRQRGGIASAGNDRRWHRGSRYVAGRSETG